MISPFVIFARLRDSGSPLRVTSPFSTRIFAIAPLSATRVAFSNFINSMYSVSISKVIMAYRFWVQR